MATFVRSLTLLFMVTLNTKVTSVPVVDILTSLPSFQYSYDSFFKPRVPWLPNTCVPTIAVVTKVTNVVVAALVTSITNVSALNMITFVTKVLSAPLLILFTSVITFVSVRMVSMVTNFTRGRTVTKAVMVTKVTSVLVLTITRRVFHGSNSYQG